MIDQAEAKRKVKSSLVTAVVLIAGCGALLFGGVLAVGAGIALRQSLSDPDFSWGPGAYVFQVLRDLVYLALVLVPVGVVLVLVGWRRVRRGRGWSAQSPSTTGGAHAEA